MGRLVANIPYLDPPRLELGDLPLLGEIPIEPFGILVALGVILGWRFCLHYAKTRDIDDWMARDVMFWVLLCGFVMAHWVSVIFYFPERIAEDPLVLLYILNGLSSVGGFLGAFLGMTWFLRKHRQPKLIYADMLTMGLLIGWCFGRAGCSWVHDHPGRIVAPDTFFAVGPWPCRCPDGGRALSACCEVGEGIFRYDLGLTEFLLTVWMAMYIFFIFDWRNAAPGRVTGIVALIYGPARVLMDFLREDTVSKGVSTPDVRYLGLTAAQWASLVIFGAGMYLVFIRKTTARDLEYAKESVRQAKAANKAAGETHDAHDSSVEPTKLDDAEPEAQAAATSPAADATNERSTDTVPAAPNAGATDPAGETATGPAADPTPTENTPSSRNGKR
ncbi:MAG: hypothetical protein B7733_17270 [Myxococcales bacterium FL481]|nr:MAG: hypothetical protein B7733_17270 [Myxococcales bacterium FL481]